MKERLKERQIRELARAQSLKNCTLPKLIGGSSKNYGKQEKQFGKSVNKWLNKQS